MIVYEQKVLDTILNSILVAYQVEKEKLLSKTRKREYVEPRQVLFAMSYAFTCNGLEKIGFYFGGKDHATIIYSIKQVIAFYETRKPYARTIDMIINHINFELSTYYNFQDIIDAANGEKKDNISRENLLGSFNDLMQSLMLIEDTETILETVKKLKELDRKIWSHGVDKNANYNPYAKEQKTIA